MILRTLRHISLWGALCLSLMVVAHQTISLLSLHVENQLISTLLAGKAVDVNAVHEGTPELRLARAYFLKQHKRYDEALTVLGQIMEKGDKSFQAKVRYNLGNIYLEQAMLDVEAMRMNTAMPLVGLAKQAYRQALTLDSGFWDAKYNFGVAMRLLPEMDRLNLEEEDTSNTQKSQLWTTVPGFPRGLP